MSQTTNPDEKSYVFYSIPKHDGSFFYNIDSSKIIPMYSGNTNSVVVDYLNTSKTNLFVEEAKTRAKELGEWAWEMMSSFQTKDTDNDARYLEYEYVCIKVKEIMELLNKA